MFEPPKEGRHDSGLGRIPPIFERDWEPSGQIIYTHSRIDYKCQYDTPLCRHYNSGDHLRDHSSELRVPSESNLAP